ncbi:MAG: hypothetical protein WEB58_01005 [Planctomycetaceae bacterium]
MSDGQTDAAPTGAVSNEAARSKLAGVEWLVSSAIAATVIGIVAMHLPPRVKLLGLFAVMVGLLAGGSLKFLMRLWGLRPHKFGTGIATVLLLALQAGIGYGTWSRQAAVLDKQNAAHPILQQMAMQKLKLSQTKTEEGSQERKHQQEMIQSIENNERLLLDELEYERSFGRYLQKRLSAVGMFSAPWPAVVWSMEILAGAGAGVWLFCRPAITDKGRMQ